MTEAIEEHPCDLLVVGAGTAGLTAAGAAAKCTRVVVVEKADYVGGSALSAGISGFHGHVMAYPWKPVLLGPDGRRLTDESLGHYRTSQVTAALPPG
jgi:flavin-dependent dehydrogenase